jgi:hypothetical protein
VQGSTNRQLDLTVVLITNLQYQYVVCLTEHWLSEEQISIIKFNEFKYVNKFCRNEAKRGGSCTFVRQELNIKEVPYMQELMSEKVLEISIVDIPELRWTLACIYRSPQCGVYEFIGQLETLI